MIIDIETRVKQEIKGFLNFFPQKYIFLFFLIIFDTVQHGMTNSIV